MKEVWIDKVFNNENWRGLNSINKKFQKCNKESAGQGSVSASRLTMLVTKYHFSFHKMKPGI